MKTKIAFDISGLSWKYRTGVQNLYWAFVDAFAANTRYSELFDITFYDRSGIFNHQVAKLIPRNYYSLTPKLFSNRLHRPMQLVIGSGLVPIPKLQNCINHVWNWGIFNPPLARASITIPDLLPLEYPQWFSPRLIKKTEKAIEFAQRDAEFINCISYDVKDRLSTYANLDPNKIRVIYPGISRDYFTDVSPQTQNTVLAKYQLIKGEYLISSGFLDPRKNLKNQIEAFSIYIQKKKTPLKYVLTGLENNLSQEIIQLLAKPFLKERMIFLGYVPMSDLKVLISASACMMYCSIAEGFGLPIIEAMALRAQVITSDSSSMRELGQGRAQLVNPEDCESIASAIERTLEPQDDVRSRLLANQQYAYSFTIERWFQGHLDHMCS